MKKFFKKKSLKLAYKHSIVAANKDQHTEDLRNVTNMSFSSDEVNFLVYRYLQESGMKIEKEKSSGKLLKMLFVIKHR